VLNKENIKLRLDKIEENLTFLKDLGKLNLAEFESDPRNSLAAQHALQISIEACLDIGNHILASRTVKRPDNYKDIFIKLGEEGIVPKEFANKIIPMAKFRNRLVHIYWEVEVEEIHRILQEELGDLETYCLYILRYLETV